MGLENHLTVVKFIQEHHEATTEVLDAKELREFLLSVGARSLSPNHQEEKE